MDELININNIEDIENAINPKENKVSRHDAREQGFILLFELDFCDETASVEELKEDAMESMDIEFCDYAEKVVKGVSDHKEELDEVISAHLKKGWKISRISKVALCILRLAVYEINYEDTVPINVAINEAVELAKKYTVDESSFVNGVLGAISREIDNK